MRNTRVKLGWMFCLVLAALCLTIRADAQSQDRRFGTQRGAQLTYEPRGPGILFDALDPALKKWYVPQ